MMWQRFTAWLRSLFAKRPTTALEAIDAIHRDKLPRADAAQWRSLRDNFASRVFSEADRRRLWRRHRRHFDFASEQWEPTRPTQADVDCLSDLLRDLAR